MRILRPDFFLHVGVKIREAHTVHRPHHHRLNFRGSFVEHILNASADRTVHIGMLVLPEELLFWRFDRAKNHTQRNFSERFSEDSTAHTGFGFNESGIFQKCERLADVHRVDAGCI